MQNRNITTDQSNRWSTCDATGSYLQKGNQVTVAFAQGSGRCSNGARSPQWQVICEFNDDKLDCEGSAFVDGKTYEFRGQFE
jgi:hypothetical protein